jgi:hypothetical protein
MLLGRPWLRDVKVYHNWGNNIITVQGACIVKIIPIIRKLGPPTKRPKVLVCYDFHFIIFDQEENLMFATELGLFSITTIVVLTSVWSNQPIKLIISVGLNLVEWVIKHVKHVFKPLISSNIHVKLIHVRRVKIVIPLDTFQQHLLKTFFQAEVGEMEINEMLVQVKVQNLCIVGWTVTEEKQLTKINLGFEKNLKHVKINVDLEPVFSYQLIELLKEFKDIFA